MNIAMYIDFKRTSAIFRYYIRTFLSDLYHISTYPFLVGVDSLVYIMLLRSYTGQRCF